MGRGASARGATTSDDFGAWYLLHHDRLRAWCRKRLFDDAAAEDVAQEALTRVWQQRDRFTNLESATPWLWCVARNLCTDVQRGRLRLVTSESVPERPDENADPARPIEVEEERQAVRAALSEVSGRHREVLYLRDVHGMP